MGDRSPIAAWRSSSEPGIEILLEHRAHAIDPSRRRVRVVEALRRWLISEENVAAADLRLSDEEFARLS